MFISSIVLKSFNKIVGDTLALGLNVLSEEYVNLSLKILFSFIDPTEFDLAFTIKSDPKTEFVDSKVGKDLYPDPKDKTFSKLTGPDANADVVEYSKTEHSVEIYEDFSGFAEIFKLKVVSPTPVTINVSL